jgi:hypothetical protein
LGLMYTERFRLLGRRNDRLLFYYFMLKIREIVHEDQSNATPLRFRFDEVRPATGLATRPDAETNKR